MGSFAGYCGWCGKPVMHKTFFGTLHLCLTGEEKLAVATQQQRDSKPSEFLARVVGAQRPAHQKKSKYREKK